MAFNISFYFYRSNNLGKDLNTKTVKDIFSQEILDNITINDIKYKDYFDILSADKFYLKVIYPGVIIGSGYNHLANLIPNLKPLNKNEVPDFQLGFYFDHTTGMPIIPGSTVKGMIKSVFPKDNDSPEVRTNKLNYINGALSQKNPQQNFTINDSNCEKIFAKEDTFFDAYICKVPEKKKKMFEDDYITPHKDQFKEPVPIRFLKIAPGIVFCFQFKLNDSCIENTQKITKKEKLDLFKQILLDFGIGAKRNVGYGNLVKP